MRSCPRTRAYLTWRTAEGKTTREIRRCLKRYIARELYRQLNRVAWHGRVTNVTCRLR
jgi:transposase